MNRPGANSPQSGRLVGPDRAKSQVPTAASCSQSPVEVRMRLEPAPNR